jgi:hypothetical protein
VSLVPTQIGSICDGIQIAFRPFHELGTQMEVRMSIMHLHPCARPQRNEMELLVPFWEGRENTATRQERAGNYERSEAVRGTWGILGGTDQKHMINHG